MPAETASEPSAASPNASSGENSDFVRLHISPLDPELVKVVLSKSAAAQARNISYHTLETFPERRYGYVELPNMEAEKLKKKLNGSVLKGSKMRVEKARPDERVELTGNDDKVDEKAEKKHKKLMAKIEESKKRKRGVDVAEGVAITDRKIKRGWTEPADQRRKKNKKDKDEVKEGKATDKKKRLKSKYTDSEECLLKTKVPPNRVADIPEDNLPKKRRKKGKGREVTVHEFEKTTKFPSFLKDGGSDAKTTAATEFVQGKGWVDEDGNVVEAVKSKPVSTPKPKKVAKAKPVVREPTPVEDDDDSTSSSGTSSSGTSSDEESDEEEEEEAHNDAASVSEKDESPTRPEHSTPLSAIKADTSRPMSSSSARSLTIKIPPPMTPSATKVHPLEALYKRSKPEEDTTVTPAQEAEPFSFFGGENEDEDINEPPTVNIPMTPFTQKDFEWRTTRSAAPTPDTAHPTRMKNFWPEDDDVEEMEDAPELDGEGDADAEQAPEQGGSSDFQSWFWENRRDLNRSWMKRRKTAAKEKRHRENKARASRAV